MREWVPRSWPSPSKVISFPIANVGDSRIYLIRNHDVVQLTNDHSLVMEQVRRGLMTLEEAEQSKMQNVIVRALGTDDSVEPDLADHEFNSEDVLLLAATACRAT